MLPNKEQQEAADNLVKMLELAPTGKGERLQPDFTPNPVLEVLRSEHLRQSFTYSLTESVHACRNCFSSTRNCLSSTPCIVC